MGKTTTLQVHHAFLYISLPSLHDYEVKMPNFMICPLGRENKTTAFPFFSLTSIQSFRIQLQKHSPTFDGLNEMEQAWQVWGDTNYIFMWRFHSCRRPCFLSSLSSSTLGKGFIITAQDFESFLKKPGCWPWSYQGTHGFALTKPTLYQLS